MQSTFKKDSFIRHPTANWGVGRVDIDSSKESVSAVFELVGYKTISLHHVTPIQVNYEYEIGRNKLNDLIKLRVYFDERFEDIYNDIKSKVPTHLVIIENGTYFEVINDDAELCRKLYGWKVHSRVNGQSLTGFPTVNKSVFYDLESKKISYVLVSQLTHQTKNIERQVDRIFNG